ncbi:hypothetical protein MRX96_015299 [Rhipicephalus microplus]
MFLPRQGGKSAALKPELCRRRIYWCARWIVRVLSIAKSGSNGVLQQTCHWWRYIPPPSPPADTLDVQAQPSEYEIHESLGTSAFSNHQDVNNEDGQEG